MSMIIKIESHYEIIVKGKKIPENIKLLVEDEIRRKLPKNVILEDSFWTSDHLTAKLLSKEELLEKIRTAK
jgi:hypothetical protein